MANRRKRLQRQADRKREQEQLDKLAQSLVEEGVDDTALYQPPSYISAVSFMVSAAISGFDQDINFRSQLEWIKLRHREFEFVEHFYPTRIVEPSDGGLSPADVLDIGNCDFVPDPISRIEVSKNGVPFPGAKVYPQDPIDRMLEESLNATDVSDSDAGDDER